MVIQGEAVSQTGAGGGGGMGHHDVAVTIKALLQPFC